MIAKSGSEEWCCRSVQVQSGRSKFSVGICSEVVLEAWREASEWTARRLVWNAFRSRLSHLLEAR